MSVFDLRKPSARQRLIVPLDVPSLAQARAIISELGTSVSFYKLGYQLLYASGFDSIMLLRDAGKQVFIDLKLLDIGNTVKNGVESLLKYDATFLTIHAYPHAMDAAVEARGENSLALLGVTVMTNLDDERLHEAGYRDRAGALVIKRALQASQRGMDGVVCSAAEASAIRATIGQDLILVTPGIRPAGTKADDQRRITTPHQAIRNGSDYLVIGRPILQASHPKKIAEAIVAEIDAAL